MNRLEYLLMRFGGVDCLLSFFCLAVLVAALGTLAGRWAKDRLKPRRSVPARFAARRSEVCRHETSRGEFTTVHFYAAFETEDGEHIEFSVSDDEYGKLAEGERGTLRYQGARYLGFEREWGRQFPLNTQYFQISDPARERAAVARAADILRRGGLLAIPTETVYGLGANGLDETAVLHIFEAKGRPQDNPLILHIPDASWLTRYCEDVPDAAYQLAERFWPGPLTMILKKKPCVPLRTTGGLETVGMRCPDHAVTRAIIEASGVPVAAPSANTSGRPSCTTAGHVREDMWGKIDGIVDGGSCQVGVESTIIDLTVTPPQLLRPGGLPLESLIDALGEVTVDKAVTQKMSDGEKPRAPGMKYRHYAPKAPVTVVTGGAKASARYLLTHAGEKSGIICFDEFTRLFDGHIVHPLGASDDKRAQAQHVFDALRTFDETNVGEIWAQCPDSKGLGLAIGNRLKKAAGFHVENADDGKIVIGITGGTGAGKTSLLRALERKGACVLDCDAVYHEMLKDDEPLLRALREAFGDAIFRQDGSVDVHAIGLIVFKDREKLAGLDAIVHEHIPRALAQKMAATDAKIIGLDAIKLIESGLGAICDATIAVTAPEEVRVRRIMARDGITEEYARSRIAAQQDAEYFRAQCGYEFVNDLPTAEEAAAAAEDFINTIINNLKEDNET